MEDNNQIKAPKQMLIELLGGKPTKKVTDAVFIQDDLDELEAEESNDYYEPPIAPRSCDNNGNFNRITKFQESITNTLNSNAHETQSIGSTVSLKTFALEPPMEYEEIIQKLEADIRKHIRIQNQLKLHIESLQLRVDEKEKQELYHKYWIIILIIIC